VHYKQNNVRIVHRRISNP